MDRPVLFCYDGSEGSKAALSVAVELVMHPADAVVLVVWTPVALQLARGGSLLAAVPNEGETMLVEEQQDRERHSDHHHDDNSDSRSHVFPDRFMPEETLPRAAAASAGSWRSWAISTRA